jgi:TRAP-type C4-dicarboxylate transport system substrate-binding protein
VLAGCSSSGPRSGADKAGGSTGPVVLRLAASDGIDLAESPLVRYFAAQVAQLSGGKFRVQVTFHAAGTGVPDVEIRTAELVRSGKFDLGWIAARAWDELGVRSFQALQAPFLITNYALLDKVVTSRMAGEMLAGLAGQHVVGLALVPGLLRHPVGLTRPLVSLSDFAGARVRDQPSNATDRLLRALGATPVHVSNRAINNEIARGRIDGEELSLANAPVGGIATANVAFFPKVLTLFAGERTFARLNRAQQDILRRAAERTLVHNTGYPVSTALAFEGTLARQYCRSPGRVVLASDQELAALALATRPVYSELERDPLTKSLIAQIQKMKASLPNPQPPAVPSSCLGAGQAGVVKGLRRSASILNGTYHWLLTAAAARAFGPPATAPGNTYPTLFTAVLRDGKWMFPNDQPPETGTYTVVGNRVVFTSGYDLTFTFVRDADGTLHLRPVAPMNRGDQWVFSGAPWRRVGPPNRTIP